MIIRKLTATFGRLKNDTLTLSPGLNIVVAPNESGKSTWCAFIKAMLYGVSTSDRDKADYLSDKTRYRPWDASPMSGTMEISCGLGDITLERSSLAKSPMKNLRATYTGSNEPVPGLTSETAGETLTGVPETVFRRSAFISQSGVRVDQTPELERRIAALVSTGDEAMSYTEADARLREWQRRRKFKKSGDIPKLEEQIAELDGEIRRLEASADNAAGLYLEVEALTAEKAELESELLLHDRLDAAAKTARVDAALRGKAETLDSLALALTDARTRRDNAEQECINANDRQKSSVYNGRDTDKITSEAMNLTRRAGLRIWMPVPVAAAAALAVIFGNPDVMPQIAWGAVAAVLMSAAIWLAFQLPAARRLKNLLSGFGVSTVAELRDAVREYAAMIKAARDAEGELTAAERMLEDTQRLYTGARTALEETEKIAREYAGAQVSGTAETPARSRAETENELRRVTGLLTLRRSEHDMAQGRTQALGDPLILRSRRGELISELHDKTLEFDAITMAIDALTRANAQLQARFAPMLGHDAGAILARLTGGRYEGLTFDRSFGASAKQAGETISRDAPALSAGTIDQIYLALRLAMMKLVLPESDPCPIILDDALTNFDDERAASALKLLREISETRQVIVLTCHDREARILQDDEKVNIVKADPLHK